MIRSFLFAVLGLIFANTAWAQADQANETLLLNESQLCDGAASIAITDVRNYVEKLILSIELLEPNDSRRALASLIRIDNMIDAGLCSPSYRDPICPTAKLFMHRSTPSVTTPATSTMSTRYRPSPETPSMC